VKSMHRRDLMGVAMLTLVSSLPCQEKERGRR